MSFRLDFVVIEQQQNQSRLALTLHNLSDKPLAQWSLHFTFGRWIDSSSLTHGELEQTGSYNILTSGRKEALKPNGHFYTEFTVGTKPFSLLDDGIIDAFICSGNSTSLINPLPVEITAFGLQHPQLKRHTTALEAAAEINIIPAPQHLKPLGGLFALTPHTAIEIDTPLAEGSSRWISTELENLLNEKVAVHAAGSIHYQYREHLADSAYQLLVEQDDIWLMASTESGFSHATASLLQLLPSQPSHQADMAYHIPMVEICDEPHFAHRGMMLDCARHFHPVERIKFLLDQLARFKFNIFHWHLTDDEGWRIEIDAYPELTQTGAWRGPNELIQPQFTTISQRYGGYYSKQEARDIIRYAADRGIMVIPEIDIPGHSRAAIKSLPALLTDPDDKSIYRSIQGYNDNILSPALEGTYTFIANVLDEICDLFPAPYLHIGADEVPSGVWADSPACRALMEKHGYEDPKELQGHLLRFAEKHLSNKGKRMMGWEEATQGDKVSKDTIIFSWLSEEAGQKCAQAGYDVVMQPAQATYLDLAQGESADEAGVDWAGRLPLEQAYQYQPLAKLPTDDPAHQHVRGIQCALWCELVNSKSRLEYMLYPRLLAIAEVAWTAPENRSWADFSARLNGQFAYLDKVGINYRRCE
ncbi:beta-N-acetylhexosaminidase [Photobacterium sp. ZSDE20]|uniref:beta-N-acetylhexosaminidase n=1 Tax=Photobacterium pectinilyticum TaxID=2906793 RepID=A0ABT1N6S6_9GAMM|nr:beta-N-acetylhexosaminidase [Photobacterium sp. ZSDE20]MCQ1058944.1 beta-N-acetylhexosaminidase [Photobacterium sp. ZSDE20]MDD1823947.1 beta-N-acetylhexosaminidase [Photobacterium sp. ZSDE20]